MANYSGRELMFERNKEDAVVPAGVPAGWVVGEERLRETERPRERPNSGIVPSSRCGCHCRAGLEPGSTLGNHVGAPIGAKNTVRVGGRLRRVWSKLLA